jgi:hypothetical protein
MRAALRTCITTAAVALSLGATCNRTTVVIPPAGSDRPPEIRLTNFVIGGSGTVDPVEVTSATRTVSATIGPSGTKCEIPRLMFLGGASNPGGVEELRVVVRRGPSAQVAYDVTIRNLREADGKVGTSIPLLGHDGAGGAGNKPLEVVFEGGKRGCPTPETIVVEATARNFNGQSSALTETLTAPGLSSAGCICE